MTETEKAYLAGIVDGEGCITVTNSTNRGQQLVLVIAMNHKLTVDYVAMLMSSKPRVGRVTTSGTPTYQVSLSGQNAQNVIRKILPYLVTKKEQAELALAFPVLDRGGYHLTPDMIEMRVEIEAEIKNCNFHYKRRPL